MSQQNSIVLRQLGLVDYEPTWRKMQQFTNDRDAQTKDEIWVLEHDSVFTQGQAGKEEHLLNTGNIPVVKVDRGGQVTYHGPGQLVMYLLIDLRRNKLGIRDMVTMMEEAIIHVLNQFSVVAYAKSDAPGVYVGETKIASLGLRVRKGCTFHGLALNLEADMSPFLRINPCGYAGMQMSNLIDFVDVVDKEQVAMLLADYFISQIGYNNVQHEKLIE